MANYFPGQALRDIGFGVVPKLLAEKDLINAANSASFLFGKSLADFTGLQGYKPININIGNDTDTSNDISYVVKYTSDRNADGKIDYNDGIVVTVANARWDYIDDPFTFNGGYGDMLKSKDWYKNWSKIREEWIPLKAFRQQLFEGAGNTTDFEKFFYEKYTGEARNFWGEFERLYDKDSGIRNNFYIYDRFKIGGTKEDYLYGGKGEDTFDGGAGDDKLFGGDNKDSLMGGAGKDSIEGEVGDDTIYGGEGNDIIYGGKSVATIFKASGNDIINGNVGDDRIYGDNAGNSSGLSIYGNDTLYGEAGKDTIYGDASVVGTYGGNDIIVAGIDADTVYGGAGNDSVFGDDWDGVAGYNDLLKGETGNDLIYGDGYTDKAKEGNDTIDGGDGNDSLFGESGNDSIIGGIGNDILYGDRANNSVSGTDTLNGGDGIDYLYGGLGNDILTGSAGNDGFYINKGEGADTITDPQASDRMYFNSKVLTGDAQYISNNMYKLGDYILQQRGSDLFVTSGKDGSASFLVKGFLPPGFNNKYDTVTNMGITLEPREDRTNDRMVWGSENLSPIVLDLDKDGFVFSGDPKQFDMDADGFTESTQWIHDRGDGFLARDLNGNGKIDNITELFGDNGGTGAYQKLALLDINKDKVIDAKDTSFSTMRIWRDENLNGRTDAGELKTLAASGIRSLSLQETPAGYSNGLNHGGMSSFTFTDGTRGKAIDIYFRVDQVNSNYVGLNTAIDPKIDLSTLVLPLSRGYGQVEALHYAMTNDAVLKKMVSDFANLNISTQMDEVFSRVYDIMARWADTPAITSQSTPAQKAAALEAMMAKFIADPHLREGNDHVDYGRFYDLIASRLLVQGPLHMVFPKAEYNYTWDRLEFNQTYDEILAQAKRYAPTSIIEKTAYWNSLAHILEGNTEYGLSAAQKTAIDNAAGFFTFYTGLNIIGTGGNDHILETNGNINAGQGNDIIEGGRRWNNFFYGQGDGNDTIIGNDYWGEPDHVELVFGPGISYSALTFTNTAQGLRIGIPGSGSILITQKDYIEFFRFADGSVKNMPEVNFDMAKGVGTAGDDYYMANNAANLVRAAAGNDIVYGQGGNDSIYGDIGNDSLFGGDGNDYVLGLTGDDVLQGNGGSDTLDGGDGIDTAAYGASIPDGGTTNATVGIQVDLRLGTAQKGADAAGDILRNIENVIGTNYDDFFIGNSKANYFEGWTGNDTISYVHSSAGVIVDITTSAPQISAGDASGDILGNMDRVIGSAFNDTLTGWGNDTLEGGAGNDILWLKSNGVMIGGAGRDIFMFKSLSNSSANWPTTIMDFTKGQDFIDLRGLGFTSIINGTAAVSRLGFSYDTDAEQTIITSTSNFKIVLDGQVNLGASDFLF